MRDYSAKMVSMKEIAEIIKAGQFAPTARDNRAIGFVIITRQEMKDKIFEVAGQEFLRNAKVLIIPAIDSEKTDCPVQDLSVATENMFLQAAALGLGTVWKNLQPDWAKKIKKLLRIPEKYKIINIIPVGYPLNKPQAHTDKDFDKKKMHEEKW